MTGNIFDIIDTSKLKKAGISNLFDMLLLAPSQYEDRRLAQEVDLHTAMVYNVVVEGVRDTPKYISFKLFCKDLQINIEAIFFQKARYLKSQFPPQKELLLYGKLSQGGFGYQIVHPKIISNTNGITPVYKISIRSDIYAKLTKRYITLENILALNLPRLLATELYKIHHPDDCFIQSMQNGSLVKSSLEALKFLELFAFLIKFAAKKVSFPAKPLPPKNAEDFTKLLPFKPTNSQLNAFMDIASDSSKPIQSRRIIIGDVGSGKTVVIAFACFLAYPQKSIILAPTSILANQLYEEMCRFLPNDFKINLLTQKNRLKDDDLIDSDAIVGTHALLHRELPACAMLIVDEQHRFGSGQRVMIEKLSSEGVLRAHYLQFSATPIPRSLAMVNSAIVNVTLMKDLPFEKNIDTHIVSKAGFSEILQKIKEETESSRQVAIVYPLVEESEMINYMSIGEGAPFWQNRFDNVYVTHGKDKNKEEILQAFAENGKILIATTLIEVGMSLPKLSTIVIVGAERLGLATLHQLRGRVSRNGLKGYCYLYTNNPQNDRLIEFSKTTSGFDIAELDLKYRNAGDLLGGIEQSGKSFKWFDYATDEDIASKVKEHISQHVF